MLIDLATLEGDVNFVPAYARAENFTGAPLYQHEGFYLHQEAFVCLQEAVRIANRHGYGMRIFDAFRPREAQFLLFDHTPDTNFLAHPMRGSPHSRGVAVDLTLYDLSSNQDIEMGTAFDAFVPESYHGAAKVSIEAERNRYLLLGIMTTAGWDYYRNEWWHYQLFNAKSYPLISDALLAQPLLSQAQVQKAATLEEKLTREVAL